MIKFLEESIKLELNVGRLYILFSEHLKEHKLFWYKLSLEELNHASLLETAKEFIENGILVDDLVDSSILDDLIKLNSLFNNLKESFIKTPTLEKAKEIGIFLEESASETHYQNVMTLSTDDKIINIIQKLNKDDIDHLERIKNIF